MIQHQFALGKAPEHLTKKQQAQLEFIAKADKRLYRAYLLKEKLRLVFQCENVAIAKEELDGWIKWAQLDNMIDMIMLRCSDIDVRLPWDYEAA